MKKLICMIFICFVFFYVFTGRENSSPVNNIHSLQGPENVTKAEKNKVTKASEAVSIQPKSLSEIEDLLGHMSLDEARQEEERLDGDARLMNLVRKANSADLDEVERAELITLIRTRAVLTKIVFEREEQERL